MIIAVVEDEGEYLDVLLEALRDVGGVQVLVARDREAAWRLIEEGGFDLMICDLRIPPRHDPLEARKEHGLGVVARARELLPGTPVVVHSAWADADLVAESMASSPHRDFVGDRKDRPLLDFVRKGLLNRLIEKIEKLSTELSTTDSIRINVWPQRLLSPPQQRCLKIFARRLGGRIVRVTPLSGGLSDASVFRVTVQDDLGAPRSYSVAKIAPMDQIVDERRRYEDYVAPLLSPGSFASLQEEVSAGAGASAAIFYGLARDAPTLFDHLAAGATDGTQVIHNLKASLEPWSEGHQLTPVAVRDIRQLLIGDEELDACDVQLAGDLRAEYEDRRVHARMCNRHGDLHGANVLVLEDRSLLIDYGEVQSAPAALDPVTLELSFLFHTDGAQVIGAWPGGERGRRWGDLDLYLDSCPIEVFVRLCREWAYAIDDDPAVVSACAYAYVTRQLKYKDTDKDLALAILQGIVNSAT